jgi:hypothetical protein
MLIKYIMSTPYDLENTVLELFNQFNVAYAKYIRCNYNNYNSRNPTYSPLSDNGEPLSCSTDNSKEKQDLDNKYNTLVTYLDNLNNTFIDLPNDPTGATGLMGQIDPTGNIGQRGATGLIGITGTIPLVQTLVDKEKELTTTRNRMDNQLNELNEVEHSISRTKKKDLDNTVYMSLLWTLITTIIIFSVFIFL